MIAVVHRGKRIGRGYGQGKKQKRPIEPRLNRLLIQTIASALLFLLVFAGGTTIPKQTADVFSFVKQSIESESQILEDVQALGQALVAGERWQDALAEVFLPVQDAARSSFPLIGEEYRARLHPWVQLG